MRTGPVWLLTTTAVLAGCGSVHQPASDPTVRTALANLQQVINKAAHPPPSHPGFKIPASTANHLHGLELWNAIVAPMIDPLTTLDGSAKLHEMLSPPQYAVYALFAIDTDVDDGGVWEVYYNRSGVFANEGVRLFELVGAPMHAAVLARANRVGWPSGVVPTSEAERRRVLPISAEPRFEALNNAWDRAEQSEGTIDSIIERFIRAHPSAFFT